MTVLLALVLLPVAQISPDGMRLIRGEVAVLAVLVLLFIGWLLTDRGDG